MIVAAMLAAWFVGAVTGIVVTVRRYGPRYVYRAPSWITVTDATPFAEGSTARVGTEYVHIIAKVQQTSDARLLVAGMTKKAWWDR